MRGLFAFSPPPTPINRKHPLAKSGNGGGLFPTQQQIYAQANWQGETMRMDKYSSGSSYWFGGITTMLGALSLNEWAVLIGIICTVGTFVVNWHYKRKEFQLREKANESSSS